MNNAWVLGTEFPELKESNLLAEGSHACVYLLSDHVVVRRLKNFQGFYPNTELVSHLKTLGYPTPTLYEVRDDHLVMERLHGPTLLQELIAQEVSLDEGVEVMVQLHEHLHSIAPPDIAAASGHAEPEDQVLHMDIHPGNIIMTATGPHLVDWEDSRYGPPLLDVASTALVLAIVGSDHSELKTGAAAMFHKFTRRMGTDYAPYLETAAKLRSQRVGISPEELEHLEPGLAWAHKQLHDVS